MIITGSFSNFYMETMLPAIRRVIYDRFNQYPSLYTKVFAVDKMDGSIAQFPQMSGVGLLAKITEGKPVGYDQPVQGFTKTFKPVKYGLAIPVSKETVEDDKFGLIKRYASDLAASAKETRELQAAAVLNNAFDGTNYAGPDGKALCATDHPLVKSGGVQTNTLSVAADLDMTSLQLAMTDYELTKDSTGKLRRIPARKVIVASANRFIAFELLKSPDRPDTANRAINALKYGDFGLPEPFVWPHLSDPDAWFIAASPEETGLIWMDRKPLYTARWYDDAAEVMYEALRYRADVGFFDFRGIYGSPGA